MHAENRMAPGAESTPVTGNGLRLSPVRLEQFDEYTLIARLGAGGMAEVLLGVVDGPSGFRKPFAIKRLHRHMADDPTIARMFLLEAAIAARLTHPNIVQTIKVGEVQGQHFIAMEYLDGQPLNRVHSRVRTQHGMLAPALAARIAADALDGLDYAHEARDFDGTPLSIVHRDVSPHNIFVTFDGQVKLLDFGIAKTSVLESMSRTGLVKGKFGYVAPEQARSELIDRRADIWSLGVTLWESLTGQRLFRGASDAQLLRAALRDDVPWVSEVAPWVPEELSRIVDQALRRDKGARFDTALEFKVALDTWLALHTTEGSRLSLSSNMQALFSDTIAQRRETLKTCFARIDSKKLERRSHPVLPQTTAHLSEPVTAASTIPSARPRRTHYRLAALSAVATLFALVAGLVANASSARRDDLQSQTQVVGTSPTEPQDDIAKDAAREPSPAPTLPIAAPLAPAVSSTTHPSPRLAASKSPIDAPTTHANPPHASGYPSRSPRKAMRAGFEPLAGSRSGVPALSEATKTPGRLRLDSTPYAVVMLEGRRVGITPIDVELPAGTHTLVLRNPEKRLETTYQVSIPEGESVERRIAIE